MKVNQKWLGLGGMFAAALLFASHLSANDFNFGDQDPINATDLFKSCMVNVEKDCKNWANKGGGGEMPHGLKTDTKVELAIGEKYILTGTIEFHNSDTYLRVDLKVQPWLANATRVKNPYYRISDSPLNWVKYRGQKLTILGTARYAVFSERGKTRFEIYIEPAAEPVIPGIQRRPNR